MKIVKYIKNSLIDFPRHISCVAFTFGCNYRCWYCHNFGLLNEKADLTDEFFEFLESRKGWLDGVVICGGEPTIQPDIVDVVRKIKAMGFDVKLDTNGSKPDVLAKLFESKLIDYVAMDIKAPKDKLNAMIGVQADFDKLLNSVNIIKNSGVECEFRTTVTPELTADDIIELAKLVGDDIPYYLQPYRKPEMMLNAPEPLSYETLKNYEKLAKTYANLVKMR